MSEEKKLLNYYVMLKNNGNGVDIFLDELLRYFESSKDVDRNNVLNVLLYLKNGEWKYERRRNGRFFREDEKE